METFLLWVLFSILVGAFGRSRDYGFWSAFLFSLLLSPLIGLIIVLLSDKPAPKREHKWEIFDEEAKRAEFKGELTLALDKYLDSLYHLKNDYSDLQSSAEKERQEKIRVVELKIEDLKKKIAEETPVESSE
tara:strand:+ start:463 stop:858 length:396 start_codon:yes stop_codon:yes gene_type:complete